MEIKDAWYEAVHTEDYSKREYGSHPYWATPNCISTCESDAKAGSEIAIMIMTKFAELRLK